MLIVRSEYLGMADFVLKGVTLSPTLPRRLTGTETDPPGALSGAMTTWERGHSLCAKT